MCPLFTSAGISPGNRPRRGRCALWRLQPRRQAVHHHSAVRRPLARVLQLQAIRARGYLWDDVSPLYAFGYGLSYTSFSIGKPHLTKKRIRRDGSARILVDVTNTGDREGTEVVQLYIRDLVSSVTRPVKELKGFQKVRLKPGETTTVAFNITAALLSFYDINMNMSSSQVI